MRNRGTAGLSTPRISLACRLTSATSHLRHSARDRASLGEIRHQVAAQIACIIGRAVDETRLAPTQERYTHQIETRDIDHTPVMTDLTFAIDRGDLEPRIVGTKSGCPNDGS